MNDEVQAQQSDAVKETLRDTMQSATEAKKRLWTAQDRVDELERKLEAERSRVVAAQRDYREAQGLLALAWDYFRDELARIWNDPSVASDEHALHLDEALGPADQQETP